MLKDQVRQAKDLGEAIDRALNKSGDAFERGHTTEARRLAVSAASMIGERAAVVDAVMSNYYARHRVPLTHKDQLAVQTLRRLGPAITQQAVLACRLLHALS